MEGVSDLIHNGETLDDLQVNNLRIIQKEKGFRFGIDAILLANFATVKRNDYIADFCSGSGVVSVIAVGKRGCSGGVQFEIQEEYAHMSQRSIQLNGLEDSLSVVCGDIGDRAIVPRERFDVVLCNPPYFPPKAGAVTEGDSAAIARHELYCDIDKVASSSAWALKFGGRLAMVHRPERLVDICTALRSANIEPKRICPVCSKEGHPPVMLLIEGIKGGKSGIVWEEPVIVYNDNGDYTERINRIYGRID